MAGPNLVVPLTLHGLVMLLAVLVYIVSSHVMRQRRQPAAAIAWMLFILLLPYLALPAFLAFGTRKLARAHLAPVPRLAGTGGVDSWVVETTLALGQPAPQSYRELHLHRDGADAYGALLETIDAARTSIDLCTFILARGSVGDAVVDRLRRRAQDGVRVRVMLDGMGALMARPPDLKPLAAAGAQIALFVPPLRSPLKGRTNLRDHRKLVIADAGLATGRLWCGGRNLAAEYFHGRPGEPPWRDLSIDLRGPLVGQAGALFERDWAFANGRPQPPAMAEASGTAPAPAGAQLVASGPDQEDDTLHSLLVTAAYRARRRICLATPYFVPDTALLQALCLAARRGVAVDLLLPARSNHRLSDLARSRALRSLAAAGARVWLAPDMLHAKLAVIDDALALSGSANFDSRSLFLNYECMLAFRQPDDVGRFALWFERERVPARPYVATPPGWVRDASEGMLLWLGFQL